MIYLVRNIKLPPRCRDDMEKLRAAAAVELGLPEAALGPVKIQRRSLDARKKSELHYVYAVTVEAPENEEKSPVGANCVRPKDGTLWAASPTTEAGASKAPGESPLSQRGWREAAGDLSLGKNVSAYTAEAYIPPALCAVPQNAPRPVVAGFGPAGIFAALVLAEAGLRPVILERGGPVAERRGKVCSVQFGEGGAGAFSDGKLNTGVSDRRIQWVLEQFVKAGAPEDILYDAKPHIGTDRLGPAVESLRRRIISAGGELRFHHRLERLFTDRTGALSGLIVAGPEGEYELPCRQLILAVGHSARDTFEALHKAGVPMAAKAFSMGARIEHRQGDIDLAQYGAQREALGLPAADYKLSCYVPASEGNIPSLRTIPQDGVAIRPRKQETGEEFPVGANCVRPRDVAQKTALTKQNNEAAGKTVGVYTFCMCPGGFVVAAASEPGGLLTNGMSNRARDGANANSALLVSVTPEMFPQPGPLGGMYWQRDIERAAFQYAGGYTAPCQTVGDFLANKPSTGPLGVLPSYAPGVFWGDMRRVLPDLITEAMARALPVLGRRLRGFDSPEALLTGPETRSSSPVRILRDASLCSVGLPGLFPCGEGAGYAGGITSAACDGIKCAEAVIAGVNR